MTQYHGIGMLDETATIDEWVGFWDSVWEETSAWKNTGSIDGLITACFVASSTGTLGTLGDSDIDVFVEFLENNEVEPPSFIYDVNDGGKLSRILDDILNLIQENTFINTDNWEGLVRDGVFAGYIEQYDYMEWMDYLDHYEYSDLVEFVRDLPEGEYVEKILGDLEQLEDSDETRREIMSAMIEYQFYFLDHDIVPKLRDLCDSMQEWCYDMYQFTNELFGELQ